jgi:predicted deacetylase
MKSRFLIRFDDICPTMNWRVWAEIEALLQQQKIKPILAVIPDNKDPKLIIDPPAEDFWERVRIWQADGWSIGLHGYQHLYVNNNPGIMRLTTRQSEFAGLPKKVQEDKLLKGLAIFAREGVRADCWVAPSHSFDWNTVDLLAELGIKVISDGLWPWPFTDRRGLTWVPQQLWRLKNRHAGIWTACNHHNSWNNEYLATFQSNLESFRPQITSLAEVLDGFSRRQLTVLDQLRAKGNLWSLKGRNLASPFLNRIR